MVMKESHNRWMQEIGLRHTASRFLQNVISSCESARCSLRYKGSRLVRQVWPALAWRGPGCCHPAGYQFADRQTFQPKGKIA